MVSRDELYRLVWDEPMIRVAERFDVSGSYLARICEHLNVPRPARGYWAKLAVGKAPLKTPLPEPLPGDPLQWSKEGQHETAPKPMAPAVGRKRKKVQIPRNQLHGLIRGARLHFENGRPVDEGAYLRPYKRLLVDVNASEGALDRALDLANDLFNALDSIGYRVVIAAAAAQLRGASIDEREAASKPRDHWEHSGLWSPDRPTVVYVGSVAIGLAVVEISENVTLRYLNGKYIRESEITARNNYRAGYSWTTTRDVPSGRLRIVAYSPYTRVDWAKQWQESKSATLHGQIRNIVEAIEASASELVGMLEEADRQAEIRQQQWLVEENRRRREEDRKRIEQSVADSKTELRQIIDQWSDLMGIERFLAGVEERAHRLAEKEKAEILERLALARGFLGSQDPLDFFRKWQAPEERYVAKYPDDASVLS